MEHLGLDQAQRASMHRARLAVKEAPQCLPRVGSGRGIEKTPDEPAQRLANESDDRLTALLAGRDHRTVHLLGVLAGGSSVAAPDLAIDNGYL